MTNLEKKLENILKKNEPIVVSINGKWGVGKTTYVSLFGKETTANIQTNISLQVIPKVRV